MRMLLVADTYPPARISGAVQMRDLAKEFVAQGHDILVLVPDGNANEAWRLEVLEGVTVLRARCLRTKDVGMIRRGISELLLPFFFLRALRLSPFGSASWDGLVWYSPTIFFGPLIRQLKARSGCASYLIVRDLFPDWAVDAGVIRKGLRYRFFKQVERFQYSQADVIGVQSPGNVPLVSKDCRNAPAKVEVLHNWLSEADRKRPVLDFAETPLAGRTVFVYAGNMGVAQGLDGFLDVAGALQDMGSTAGFLFVGRGSEVGRLCSIASEKGLQNVVFMEEVEPDDIPGLLAQCHIGIVALDVRHNTHNIPGKFLAYMRSGLPVLARINPGNDLQSIIDAEGVGTVLVEESKDALRFAIESLVNDQEGRARMARNALALGACAFSPSATVRQIIEGLERRGVATASSFREDHERISAKKACGDPDID